MPTDRKKAAPEGCYWRGSTLWAHFTVAGKEYRFSLKTGDPVVARNRQTAEHARITAAASFGDDRKRWEEALKDWGAHIVHHIGARTFHRYLNSLEIIGDHLDGLFVDEISDDTVAAIIKARRSRGRTTATIRRDLTALSSVLAFAIDERWRKGNPALDAMQSRRMKERRDPIVLPEDRDIATAVARAPGNLKFLIRAALLTGCRQDELVTLERRHVDLARKAISVHGKGNKRRMVSLSDEAVALFREIPVSMATRHVFWHSEGKPFANVATRFSLYGRQLAAEAEKAGGEFRRFRFHDLRHRFAVDYLRSGRGSIYMLQQELGHTSLLVTELYLSFLTAEEVQAAKERHTKLGTGVSVYTCRIRLKYCRDCGMCEMRKCRIWVYNTAVLHRPAPRLLAAMDRAFNPTAPNRHFRVPARLRQRWDCGAFARGGDENALPD